MKPVYLFDIDGTIANCDHRLHHIQKTPPDWDAFYEVLADDAPIPHIVAIVRALCFIGHEIVFATGRSERCRQGTVDWLIEHVFRDDFRSAFGLYMREDGDHRADWFVKIERLAEMRKDGFEPVMVFEDRAAMTKAWRQAGIPCAQVVEGDY